MTKHGLLMCKPDEKTPLDVKATWERVFSHKWDPKKSIVPEFEVQKGQTHRLDTAKLVKKTNTSYFNNMWSGAVVSTGNFTKVWGTWTIPYVSKPPQPQGTEGGWNSSSWVGIDGWSNSNDVLQAGVQQRVDANGKASYVAWYEWYAPVVSGSPAYVWQTNITNFPVNNGDIVNCWINYASNKASGSVTFGNQTTGHSFSITLAPPPGATFNGSDCEWIMEAPDWGEPISSLPQFSTLVFTGCGAYGGNGFKSAKDCNTLEVQNTSAKVLTHTTVNADTVVISYYTED